MRQTKFNIGHSPLEINDLSRQVIGAALNVHRTLGMGLPSSTYMSCLMLELSEIGIHFDDDLNLPLFYKNHFIESGLHIDLLVNGQVIVHIVTSDCIDEKDIFTVLNQLRHADLKLGIILNFGAKLLRGDAIKRVVNGHIS